MLSLTGAHSNEAQPHHVDRPDYLTGPKAFIWHYVKTRPGQFATLMVMATTAAACAVAVQYMMKLLVDAMASQHDTTPAFIALSGFIGLIAAESLLWRCSGWLGCRATVGVGVKMRLDLFDYLAGQPIRYFAENLAGSLGQRLTSTAGAFGAFVNTLVWRISPPCIDFIGALIVFSTVDWGMTGALAVAVVLLMTGLIMFGERGRHLHRTFAAEANQASGDLVDVISNMWSVKAFSAHARERKRLSNLFTAEADAQRASWMYTERARFMHDIALWVLAGGMLTWAVLLWSRASITPGEVVVVSALTFRILHGSRDMALSLVELVQHFGFIEDTLKVIGQRQTVRDVDDAPVLSRRGGSVEFRNVVFSYGKAGEALHDINIKIPAGQKVGIVGPSGAGKSTLVHLLQRLYDIDSGSIWIDGQNIHEVTQDSLRQSLAVVPQEITLLHRTVMENIRFARADATDDEIFRAAKAAHCEKFIHGLSEGYDTIVGERGTKLSGGQRQRIGIARAFLKDAPIIVLDEATSALDTESEMEIQRSIVELMHDRTVIAVAHRLSTLSNFDRVIVVEQGQIVEDGKPAELRKKGNLFDRMWRLQAEGLAAE
ncbi:ABC transporter ATP-binding protein [Rhizobium deserti]|uniref:ABC transporter ATP-binding protein n=1 Tax=Rhizobium deserti TaxID=2547961 RepID=A0A4R5UI78_9HYPH|nr:ABC transporter ATP-binding protein [Rhizobium deserti]TDK35556.1 ABC transporter ATP-binding protein [Rhizobium deserti]